MRAAGDDALRTLEREARSTADGEAILRWATALDRAGRPAEAYTALVTGRDHPAVRVALGARPLDPGPPILARPVVRWRRKPAGTDKVELFRVTPLGIVLGSKARLRVLEPDDGSPRFELQGAPWWRLAGDVLLAARAERGRLEAFDVWTGERLFSETVSGGLHPRSTVLGRWLLQVGERELLAHDLSDPRRPPVFAWRRHVERPHALTLWPGLADVALVKDAWGALRRLDLRAGDLSAVVQADGRWLCAGHGVGVAVPPPRLGVLPIAAATAYDLAGGELRWTSPLEAWRWLAATPDGFLGAVEAGPEETTGGSELVRLDPDGQEVERCDLAPVLAPAPARANRALSAPEVDYVVQDEGARLVAWARGAGPRRGGRGGPAWVWAQQPRWTVRGSSLLAGRLYLHVGRATVVCLEAPA
jgi:hypothetical protein